MNYRNYYPMACKKIDNYHKRVGWDNILEIGFHNKIVVVNKEGLYKVVADTDTDKEAGVEVVAVVEEEVEVAEQLQVLEVEVSIVE
jgi:hypothetical protein